MSPNIPFLEQSTEIKCSNCESVYFQESVTFRKVSRLLTGDLKDNVYPFPAVICVKCQTPLEEFKVKV